MKGDRIIYEGQTWVISEVKSNTLIIKTLNLSNLKIKEISL
jgi:hypothetical protein